MISTFARPLTPRRPNSVRAPLLSHTIDEVTSALDPTLVGEVLDLLTDLAHHGTTMLIATHEMNFAKDVSHQIAFLEKGVLVEKGTPDQMFNDPTHEATRKFLERSR